MADEVEAVPEQPAPFTRVQHVTDLGQFSMTSPTTLAHLEEASKVVQQIDDNRKGNRMLVQNNNMKILDKQIELAGLKSPNTKSANNTKFASLPRNLPNLPTTKSATNQQITLGEKWMVEASNLVPLRG